VVHLANIRDDLKIIYSIRNTSTSKVSISYYIYIYTGGGLYRGIWGIGLLLIPPPDIDMIDSMILWMKIMLFYFFLFFFVFDFLSRLYEPGVFWG
jgi:hypothetical protein